MIGPLLRWLNADVAVTAAQVQEWLVNGAQSVLKSAAELGGQVALGVFGTLLDFALMVFLLFYFLRDGPRIFNRLLDLVPLEPERRARLIQYLAEVTRAVVYGHSLTALAQGALVGIGFAIVQLPSPVVFAVLAALAALLPGAGTGFVLIPAVLYLAIDGRWGAALFLALWSVGIGICDNLLRPYLTRQHAAVSTLVVFVGVIGGRGRLRPDRSGARARAALLNGGAAALRGGARRDGCAKTRRKALENGRCSYNAAPMDVSPSSIR